MSAVNDGQREPVGGPHPQRAAGPLILIVDDSPTTTQALAALLHKAGYRTAEAHRGADALAAADAAAGQGGVAAAVVDIHLPDLSGLVVSQKLRERLGPGAPIIILSGDTSMQTLNSLPHVGADYFFSKPVNTADFLERLREWLGGRGGAQQA